MLENELLELLEHTADAAYTVTEAGEICAWNGAAEGLFGIPNFGLEVRTRAGISSTS